MTATKPTGDAFHKASIHERRVAAYLCRALPLLVVMSVLILSMCGAFKCQALLLALSAFFNVALWLWVVSTAIMSIHAALFKLNDLECGLNQSWNCVSNQDPAPNATLSDGSITSAGNYGDSVVHLIVLPNYGEDESMLAETLQALSEAEGSRLFWVVLGMEEREGEDGKQKAARLKMRFGSEFARVLITSHPANLVESHLDGSEDSEVPGKASNLKYAVDQAFKECSDIMPADRVILTVADSDCIFHPRYFSQLGKEFQDLRKSGEHQWTMWQAPQFPYRNYYTSPIVSRVWGYVASTYEFGGLSGTAWGAHHMVFSSYSLPLTLAHDASPWDGDVVAEDHHAWLKCYYYSLRVCANQKPTKQPATLVKIRPIFLPVKSTSVETKGSWKAWIDRWDQAKRHAQGVAELSYALLATYDAWRTCLWPRRMLSWDLFRRLSQVLLRIFCMHILPICQTICLGTLTIKWLWHGRSLAMCPDRLWFFGNANNLFTEERYLLCGFAGAWVLTWPVVVPWALIMVSNFLIIYKSFIRPSNLNRYGSIWHSDDGKVPRKNSCLRVLGLLMFDCLFGMTWILVPYGFLVELVAYFNVLIYGNRFSYVCAPKGTISKSRGKGLDVDGASIVISSSKTAKAPFVGNYGATDGASDTSSTLSDVPDSETEKCVMPTISDCASPDQCYYY